MLTTISKMMNAKEDRRIGNSNTIVNSNGQLIVVINRMFGVDIHTVIEN